MRTSGGWEFERQPDGSVVIVTRNERYVLSFDDAVEVSFEIDPDRVVIEEAIAAGEAAVEDGRVMSLDEARDRLLVRRSVDVDMSVVDLSVFEDDET
jgi:hypothetical protein